MEKSGVFRRADGRTTYTLLELAEIIEGIVEQVFDERLFWVIAEITDVYFSKERQYYRLSLSERPEGGNVTVATFSATIWRNVMPRVRLFEDTTGFSLSKGIKVMLSVKVRYHKVYGLSLDVADVDPSYTIGELHQQREQTLNQLMEDFPADIWKNEEGKICTSNQQLPVPRVLLKVALISSQDAQGSQDFLNELMNNQFGYKVEVQIFQSLVQGDAAPDQLCEALAKVSRLQKKLDAVVIVRGGGASTDLLAFDDYYVAANVATFPIPVITGIGHTRDVSLSDVMAWQSVKTPTKAAEAIISYNYHSELEALQMFQLVANQSKSKLQYARYHIDKIGPEISIIAREKLQTCQSQLVYSKNTLHSKSASILNKQERKLQPAKIYTLLTGQRLLLSKSSHLLQINLKLKFAIENYFSARKNQLSLKEQAIKHHKIEHWLAIGGSILAGSSISMTIGEKRSLKTKNQTAIIEIIETNEPE